jgi:hypothetical protein
MNDFIKENTRGAGTSYTENGAVSYATMGSALLDQFGKAGTARGRNIDEVWAEQGKLWSEDAENALKFPFYLRLITRQTNVLGGEKTETVQRGQGARDESFKRLLWIAKYHPDEFYRNLWLVPVVGSWKDIWQLLFYASQHNVDVDVKQFYQVLAEGINDDNHRDLVKKYMPRIRSERKCGTPWAKATNKYAKGFAQFAGWSFKDYRNFKATGKAHQFQTVICKGLYSNIDWKTIPGKALLNLVTGKFLTRHNLEEEYLKWLETQPVAKFNGYPFELGMKLGAYCNPSRTTRMTVDKQFMGLVKTGKSDGGAIKGNVLCALDTSGSMGARIQGGPEGLTSYDVCVSLGIYFSELNTGAFHNVVAMFDSTSRLKTLSGTFTDKWFDIRRTSTAWGSTNFQSLIDLLVSTRRNSPQIPIEDYPKTLLVVSDMQFNPSNSYRYTPSASAERTNYEAAMAKLRQVFPEEFVNEFKIVWWFCAGRKTNDYPSTMDDAGTYMISGFDGAVVSLLLGGEEKVDPETGKKVQPTMEELVSAALNQSVLALVK